MAAAGEDRPGVLVRPPALFLLLLLIGFALDFLWPTAALPDRWQYAAGLLLLALGAALMAGCLRRMRAAGTTHKTREATTAIVTGGAFRHSRNPLYVALVLVFLGIGVVADNLWLLGLSLPLVAVLHWGVVLPEERYLEGKFGGEYLRYKAAARRWL